MTVITKQINNDDTRKIIWTELRNARKGKYDYFTCRGIWGINLAHWINVCKKIDALVEETGGRPIRILDVGCGCGVFVKKIKKKFGDSVEVHALDVTNRREWVGINGVSFHNGHAENLEKLFPRNYFHLVISTYGLCYSPNQLNALSQAQTIATENGWIIAHVNYKKMKKSEGISAKDLAKGLDANLVRVVPFPLHPFFSLQFRKKTVESPLQ